MITPAVMASTPLDSAQCLDDERRAGLVVLGAPGGRLTAVIDPMHGGSLVGLQLDRRELLYRGMNFCPVDGWDGKAPVLWPATGRNYAADPAGNEAVAGWTMAGQWYPMPIHGFARTQSWHVLAKQKNAITLGLADNAQTRRYYPFGFRLRLTYTLQRDGLSLAHQVIAGNGQAAMPFSIGNHVTFVVHPGAIVSTTPTRRVTLDAEGRPNGTVTQSKLDRLPISGFPRLTAMSLAGYAPIAQAMMDLGNGVSVSFSQSVRGPRPQAEPIRYNLWGDPAAGYFAVEPWYGRQNALAEGAGVVFLPPGRTFAWHVNMRIVTLKPQRRN